MVLLLFVGICPSSPEVNISSVAVIIRGVKPPAVRYVLCTDYLSSIIYPVIPVETNQLAFYHFISSSTHTLKGLFFVVV